MESTKISFSNILDVPHPRTEGPRETCCDVKGRQKKSKRSVYPAKKKVINK